jgi:hypothetical protein
VPALSENKTLKLAKKKGGLAKNDICGKNVKNAGEKKNHAELELPKNAKMKRGQPEQEKTKKFWPCLAL